MASSIKRLERFEMLLKHKFFFDQSFSIYNGMSGLFDLGPFGCEIQKNIIREWRKHFVLKEHMQEIDCPVLTAEQVLKASGHLTRFSDLMVRDSITNESFRVDHLLEGELNKKKPNKTLTREEINTNSPEELDKIISKHNICSPKTGNKLTQTTEFNLMFQTQFGPSGQQKCYLRPETSQGIFTNFKNLYRLNNKRLPLAVAQIGKSFRNEISPKSGLVRQREFLVAEIEHFMHPDNKLKQFEKFKSVQDVQVNLVGKQNPVETIKMKLNDAISNKLIQSETFAYYMGRIHLFALHIGIDAEKLRFRQHLDSEMAHYANECWDLECLTAFGWLECVGLADRCDFDLKQHSDSSGQDLMIDANLENKAVLPHVIEPSFGIGRLLYTVLEHNYKERNQTKGSITTYFSFPTWIAPYKCVVLPLNSSDEKYQPFIDNISETLIENEISHQIDDARGSIGKRYCRADEIGTKYAITLDYRTLEDSRTVTLRERDSTKQIRVKIKEIPEMIQDKQTISRFA